MPRRQQTTAAHVSLRVLMRTGWAAASPLTPFSAASHNSVAIVRNTDAARHRSTHVLSMPKRKRSSSLPSPSTSPRLRLTQRNLDRLQQSLKQPAAIVIATAAAMSRVSSPSRKNNLDIRTKLEAYRINIDKDDVYPPALAHHIETVVRRPRDPNADTSPNAKKIVEMRRYVAAQNERTGINKVAPYMLFVGEADFEDRGRPLPHITAKQEIGLNKAFLPPAPTIQIKETEGALSSP